MTFYTFGCFCFYFKIQQRGLKWRSINLVIKKAHCGHYVPVTCSLAKYSHVKRLFVSICSGEQIWCSGLADNLNQQHAYE